MKRCLLLLLLPLSAGAAEHVPWALDGVQTRIEKHRKGPCSLQLVLPDGRSLPGKAEYELEQVRHAFNFGGSLAADWQVPKQEWYPAFKQQFANLFNYATIDFYWAVHEKRPGQWRYNPESREKLDWAKSEGMRLRGHPLMWHEVVPEWIMSTNRPVMELHRDILDHISMLAGDFPEIDEWDLYNEAPGIRLKEPAMGVRRWVESQGGPGPVTEVIVNTVRSIRPDGRFIVNHFSDRDPEYHQQIGYCISNNVSFDAIGIQTHMHNMADTLSEQRLWDALETYARYGKPLQLSEISILSCETFPDWELQQVWEKEIEAAKRAGRPQPCKPSTPEWEQYQAEFARDLYTLAFSHPSVEAIIWWTITDLEPWRGMPAGLLDAGGNPKPVYEALNRLINEEWRTQVSGRTDHKGRMEFKGFYGDYEVRVEVGGKKLFGTFSLDRGTNDIRNVVLSRSQQMKENG
jgi:GH35 family endo-1,4-beta-xylanase